MRHFRKSSGSLELTALRLPVSPANRVSNQPHDAPESVIPGALFIGWLRNDGADDGGRLSLLRRTAGATKQVCATRGVGVTGFLRRVSESPDSTRMKAVRIDVQFESTPRRVPAIRGKTA